MYKKLLPVVITWTLILGILAYYYIYTPAPVNKFLEKVGLDTVKILPNSTYIRTGSWWKDIYENHCNSTLYAFPYKITLTSGGIDIALPHEKVVNAKFVSMYSNDSVNLLSTNLNICDVSETYDVGATIALSADNSAYSLTAHSGLGYVFLEGNSEFKIPESFEKFSDDIYEKKLSEGSYYIKVFNNGSAGFKIAFLYLNTTPEITLKYLLSISSKVPKVKVAQQVIGDKVIQAFLLNTRALYYSLPHQNSSLENPIQTISTIRGNANLMYTNKFVSTYSLLRPDIFPELTLNDYEKTQLQNFLEADIKDMELELKNASSSYFHGKVLAKFANLLYISKLVGDSEAENKISVLLQSDIDNAFGLDSRGSYLKYNEKLNAFIHSNPDFGSDKLNDHHFHYGYYIYAIDSLIWHDPALLIKYKKPTEDLISSIAGLERNSTKYAFLRYFDLYEGHSYAAGLETFGDGNNQESSSEAMNFWYSSYMFHKLSNNESTADQYLALYNLEKESLFNYYFGISKPNSNIFPSGYTYPIASIIWHNKYDFATWFSDDKKAILGIQFIPITFGSSYLKSTELADKLQPFISGTGNGQSEWNDFLNMYLVLNRKNPILPESLTKDLGLSKTWYYFITTILY